MLSQELTPIAVDAPSRILQLLDMKGAAFHEPFFHETIELWRQAHPRSKEITVHADALIDYTRLHPRPPEAFIFHAGRCGSTLFANMLTASGDYAVLKEPEVVSDLIAHWLTSDKKTERDDMEALLAAVIHRLSEAAGIARHKALKFAAWNVQLAGVLLKLFPDTPAIFIYRSPTETVASLSAQLPSWFGVIQFTRQFQARFYPTLSELPADIPLSPALLFAHAWRSCAEAALEQSPDRLFLIDYRDLVAGPAETIANVMNRLNHPVLPEQLSGMLASLSTYSKDRQGGAAFDPGGVHRRSPLSRSEEALVRAVTAGTWSRLTTRRAQTSNTGGGLDHAA